MNWRWLLGLCEHEWKLLDTIQSINPKSNTVSAYIYVRLCKKCGKIKRTVVRGAYS